MIDELVLHQQTRRDLDNFLQSPSHGLLLIGAEGSGKPSVALAIAGSVLQIAPDKLSSYPYFMHLKPEKNSVTIEAVRGAQEFVRLRTTGTADLRRVIIIEDAHKMSTEAQNAFLKLLEEPPQDTVIILTAEGAGLLPTITSRAQKVVVKAPAQDDLVKHFASHSYETEAVTRNYHLSRGHIGLMTRLLEDSDTDELLEYITAAKDFLRLKPFEKLVYIDQFTKKKRDVAQFLWALQRVAGAALFQSAQKGATRQVAHWQKALTQILQAEDSLGSNPQAKLLLTNLSLHL